MGAVEQHTDDCLGGAGVVDDLGMTEHTENGAQETDVKNTQEAESLTHDAARRITPQQNQMPSPAGCQIQGEWKLNT